MFWIKMWTESQGRLPTYLLMGGSGLNVVHTCITFFIFFIFFLFFFYFYFCMSRRYAYLEDDRFGLWLMLSEDQRFWILAHVFRGLGFLDLGSCF